MKRLSRTLPIILGRAVLGFMAGFLVAFFVLMFLGVSHGHWDLGAKELEQEYRAHGIALLIATASAILAAAGGSIRVPRFLATLTVAFGLIAVIPFWPCGLTGRFLPFGTPYVNWGYSHADAVQLACHIAAALLLAGVFEGVWKAIERRRTAGTAGEDSQNSSTRDPATAAVPDPDTKYDAHEGTITFHNQTKPTQPKPEQRS